MWIIAKTASGQGAFVSLVAHDSDDAYLRARARKREHLVAAFNLEPHEVIDLGADAPDYRWHANVTREQAAEAVWNMVWSIDYASHVKEEVTGEDTAFYNAMLRCWGALRPLQGPRSFRDDDEAWWAAQDDEPAEWQWNRQGVLTGV